MYYQILVASIRYHKSTALTYSSTESLAIGSVVTVPLQKQSVLGIVSGRVSKPAFRVKPISKIILEGALTAQHLSLLSWLKLYYPSPGGPTHALFAPSFLAGPLSNQPQTKKLIPQKLPPLTTEQSNTLKTIKAVTGHSVLLHGITGSGKTRIYVELSKEALDSGRSVIILTPEIGLTPQLIKVFRDSLPSVVTLHSGMTPKERRQAWFQIATSSEPLVVIGPRSALFSPVRSVGLIVVDEMHDSAYKQEQAPYYLTSRVAGQLAAIQKAKVVLASATPPVADYYLFQQQQLPIITMTQLATGNSDDAKTSVIDLKDRGQFSRSYWLSSSLIASIQAALQKKEQSLLFLNRRGTARIILCQVCGWQAHCPRCDLPLTYHADTHKASCHTCGYSQPAPSSCAVCGSTEIIFKSAGTKSIVAEVKRLFPKANVQRFDSDLKKEDRLGEQYDKILNGQVDILVGTQMLGKGLDLPRLSVVGVVLADTALNFPDFTAEERTFQMLNQVIGRVGRGHRRSQVIIQTYNPESLVIQEALTNDYQHFYARQLEQRQRFRFPPFCYLLKLSCTRRSQASAQTASMELFKKLESLKLPIEIIGPTGAFIERKNNQYQWQLVIKAQKRSTLLRVISVLPANWFYDLDPSHLL